jgi:hypothetical protein
MIEPREALTIRQKPWPTVLLVGGLVGIAVSMLLYSWLPSGSEAEGYAGLLGGAGVVFAVPGAFALFDQYLIEPSMPPRVKRDWLPSVEGVVGIAMLFTVVNLVSGDGPWWGSVLTGCAFGVLGYLVIRSVRAYRQRSAP